jgi:hypothetical protein
LPDGRRETFHLYYVDTTESRSRGKRSDKQAAYFYLTRAQAIDLGRQAKAFTAKAVAEPFTIYTRWRAEVQWGQSSLSTVSKVET